MDAKSFRGWLCQLGELSDRLLEQLKHRLLGGEAIRYTYLQLQP